MPFLSKPWFRFSALALMAVSLFFYLSRSIRNLQYKLLYYPGSSALPEALLQALDLRMWRPSGVDYKGLLAAMETRALNGTVIVFHGNGGTAADRTFYPDALGPLGYRVVLAEYPKYGGRKGELGEKAFVSDALESTRMAFEDFGGPLFLLGESLGCGIAAAVAREAPVQIHGVILITPWDTLASVAKAKFPFLPVRLFLKDRYDNIGNLGSFKGRIAVIGAGRDEILPVAHAKNLYGSLPGTASRMWILQEAGHNDWFMHTNKAWWQEVMGFISGKG